MVTVSIATSLTSYIPMLLADSMSQGLQVCKLLKEIDASLELVHAVCSHGYNICTDVEPTHFMEKVLTGIIVSLINMRPSHDA